MTTIAGIRGKDFGMDSNVVACDSIIYENSGKVYYDFTQKSLDMTAVGLALVGAGDLVDLHKAFRLIRHADNYVGLAKARDSLDIEDALEEIYEAAEFDGKFDMIIANKHGVFHAEGDGCTDTNPGGAVAAGIGAPYFMGAWNYAGAHDREHGPRIRLERSFEAVFKACMGTGGTVRMLQVPIAKKD